MHTLQAIENRRSVKYYDPEHVMPEHDVNELLRLATLSPTAFNQQNWRFVVVHDAEQRRRIRAIAWDQPQVTDASLFVVLCADTKAWEKEPHRYWQHAPKEYNDFAVAGIGQFYRGREQLQRDEAMRSCGIAGQTLLLAATAMGYDTCPMAGFDAEELGGILKLPDDHVIGMAVAIGKGTKAAWPRPGQLPVSEVVVSNHF